MVQEVPRATATRAGLAFLLPLVSTRPRGTQEPLVAKPASAAGANRPVTAGLPTKTPLCLQDSRKNRVWRPRRHSPSHSHLHSKSHGSVGGHCGVKCSPQAHGRVLGPRWWCWGVEPLGCGASTGAGGQRKKGRLAPFSAYPLYLNWGTSSS